MYYITTINQPKGQEMAKKQINNIHYAMALYIENGLMAAYSPKLGNIKIGCFEEDDEIDFKASLQGDWIEYRTYKRPEENYAINDDEIFVMDPHGPTKDEADGEFVRNISLNERKRKFAVAMWEMKTR